MAWQMHTCERWVRVVVGRSSMLHEIIVLEDENKTCSKSANVPAYSTIFTNARQMNQLSFSIFSSSQATRAILMLHFHAARVIACCIHCSEWDSPTRDIVFQLIHECFSRQVLSNNHHALQVEHFQRDSCLSLCWVSCVSACSNCTFKRNADSEERANQEVAFPMNGTRKTEHPCAVIETVFRGHVTALVSVPSHSLV